MKLAKAEMNNIETSIISHLSSVPSASRKDVITNVMNKYSFSEKAKNDPNSKCNAVRSYIGSAFNAMVLDKKIEKVGNGYTIRTEKLFTVDKNQCKTAILNFLKKKPYSKKELYTELQKHFKTDETKSEKDDNQLKQMAGQLIGALVEENKIELKNEKYTQVMSKDKIDAQKPLTEQAIKKIFSERLCNCGGSKFEKFVANLLEKYYLVTGREVLNCEVVGGSEDGGIDVAMDITDELGFSDNLLIQAKCRKNAQVTEKEVREFFGALNVKGGTRGIFVTSSSFHPNAEKLLLSLNNCIGIDGDRIFTLAKRAAYGIRKNKNGFLLDESVFEY